MYVKDRMTVNPICLSPTNSISDARDIMTKNHLHRLPVVDKDNKLLGLVSETVIANNTPNSATSLSVYELNYILNKITIQDIMIKNVITINKDALLEEAAISLKCYQIGCLPVVEDDKLVGIITRNDILASFCDLLGYNKQGTRFVINVSEDKVGIFEDICRCFKECETSISNVVVYHNSRGIEIVVVANCKDPDAISKYLQDNGYNITSVMNYKS